MSMTSRILLGVISLGLWAACEPPAEAPAEAPAQELTLQSEDEKTIYAIGLALAGNLAALGLSEQELAILQLGLSDGVQDAEPKLKLTDYRKHRLLPWKHMIFGLVSNNVSIQPKHRFRNRQW